MNIISEKKEQTTENLFKALSHPARVAILEELRKGEHCVCHLEACLGSRQSYVSQQLAVLREAGLILDRRDGWNVYYRIADSRIFDLLDAAYAVTGYRPEPIDTVEGCPCPRCNTSKRQCKGNEKC